MSPIWWVLWSGICAVGTGLLVYFIMQSHMEVVLAKQREELAAARATLAAQREALENSLKNTEESARHQAMDDFLADIRVEERHYTREHKVLFMSRKMLVRQERIFFRNIPLSNWVEQEMALEEGVDAEKMARTMSIFVNAALLGDSPESTVQKLLR
ncbi:MAG: hypothetical protein ABSG41_09970 [Bryobacteraceae bacterium]|jgi:uncharacterized membrane protein YgaE (UPF0421/DUF939 family)